MFIFLAVERHEYIVLDFLNWQGSRLKLGLIFLKKETFVMVLLFKLIILH
jgi:hypothetical protein